MTQFFTYADRLPPGTGYRLFGPEHAGIILVSLCMILACIYMYRKSDQSFRSHMKKTIALLLPVLIVLRLIYVYLAGAALLYELPLHMCSIAGVVCFVYEYSDTRLPAFIRSVIAQAMYAVGLPGAVLAILFSDGTMYPVVHFITIESGLFHVLIIIYISLRMLDGDVYPDIREAYKCLLFLLFTVTPVFLFDRHFRTNYMFLMRPSLGSPFSNLYSSYGYIPYLIGYGSVTAAEIIVINLVGGIIRRIACRHKNGRPDILA